MPKSSNPANIPQQRPLENFWACLGHKVYEKSWQAKSHDQLVSRSEFKLNEFDLKYLQLLMKGITSQLRNIADIGVFGTYKKGKMVKTHKTLPQNTQKKNIITYSILSHKKKMI